MAEFNISVDVSFYCKCRVEAKDENEAKAIVREKFPKEWFNDHYGKGKLFEGKWEMSIFREYRNWCVRENIHHDERLPLIAREE